MTPAETKPSSVHDRYGDPEVAAGLAESWRAASARSGAAVKPRCLICVPSNPDLPIAALLGVRAERLLLIRTRDDLNPGAAAANVESNIEAIRAWTTTVAPALGVKVRVEVLGTASALGPEMIVPHLLDLLPGESLDACVVLISTGTTAQKTRLARFAEAFGLVQLRTDTLHRGGTQAEPGKVGLAIDQPPVDVRVQEQLIEVREALVGRRYGEAKHRIAEVRGSDRTVESHGLYLDMLQHWTDSWTAFDAMRLEEAVSRLDSMFERVDSAGSRLSSRPVQALLEAAEAYQKRIRPLVVDVGAPPGHARWRLMLEIIRRGAEEEHAERLNHAALLYYRAIEGILSERLRVAWGIDDSKATPDGRRARRTPDAAIESISPELLEARFVDHAGARKMDRSNIRLPLGLREKLVLLIALEDPNLPSGPTLAALESVLNSALPARNQSIFAHGYRSLEVETVRQLRSVVLSAPSGASTPSPVRSLFALLVEKSQLGEVAQLWEKGVVHVDRFGSKTVTLPPPRLHPTMHGVPWSK